MKMGTGMDEKLLEAVLTTAQEEGGRRTLSCAEAFRLAAELGVEPGDIGRVCNAHNVKITRCQMGCF